MVKPSLINSPGTKLGLVCVIPATRHDRKRQQLANDHSIPPSANRGCVKRVHNKVNPCFYFFVAF